jgi:hypothetical protein
MAMYGIGTTKKQLFYFIEVEHENSKLGINGGKIIEMQIRKNGEDLFKFENGRIQVDTKDTDAQALYEELLHTYDREEL